jgi:hypothetical protein
MANLFDKERANWKSTHSGLVVPRGANVGRSTDPTVINEQYVRRNFQDTPLEAHKKTREVEIPKVALHAFRIELARLQDKYLDSGSSMQALIQFENAARALGEEYGVTVVMAVDGDGNVLIDTEEIITEVAGDLTDYEIASKYLHGGVAVKDDLGILMNPNASDKDNELLN